MENMNKMKKGSNSKEPPLSEQRTQKEKYEVFVDDNFHFMDERARMNDISLLNSTYARKLLLPARRSSMTFLRRGIKRA
jgi:hypothetical protein